MNSTVLAAATEWSATSDCVVSGAATIRCLEPMFKNVVIAVTSLAVLALFFMLIAGGFNFLFAGGDQKKLDAAGKTITGAITGIVIIVAATLILRLVAQVFKVDDVLRFTIPVL